MLSVSSCEYWDISPVGPGVTNLPRCDARRKRNGTRDRVERKKKNPQIARDSKICLDYDSGPRGVFFTPFSMVSVDDRLSFEAWEMRIKTVVLISFRQKLQRKMETDAFKKNLWRSREKRCTRGRSLLPVSRIPVSCEHLEVYERVMAWWITLFRVVC